MADLRPARETFACGTHHVTLVDAAGLLAAPTAGRLELVRETTWPGEIRMGITTQAGTVHLDATVRPGRPKQRATFTAVGNDPLGSLLAHRAAAGDRWATDLVDGIDTVATRVSRRLGTGRAPVPPSADVVRSDVWVDVGTDLRATVTETADRAVTIHAAVPAADVTPAHLRALACRVLAECGRLGPPAGETGYTLLLGAVPTGGVTLDQVGGLDAVVAEFRQIAVTFRHPDAMARWGARRPQGILLHGPPGTGKTMLARALAAEIGAEFREIHTPEIIDKWLGSSERNLKRIFREARRHRGPLILFFDEFDSIISYVGSGEDAAGQAVNAVAGIFKQELNTLVEANPDVIVVATTNFPERIDDSLIRSGRFDVRIAIPLPDEGGRAAILTRMIRDLIARHERDGFRMFADDVDPAALAARATGLSGADLGEVLRRVRLAKAVTEAHTTVPPAPIDQADLLHAVDELRR